MASQTVRGDLTSLTGQPGRRCPASAGRPVAPVWRGKRLPAGVDKKKEPGDRVVIRLVEGAVTYSPTFAVPSAW